MERNVRYPGQGIPSEVVHFSEGTNFLVGGGGPEKVQKPRDRETVLQEGKSRMRLDMNEAAHHVFEGRPLGSKLTSISLARL